MKNEIQFLDDKYSYAHQKILSFLKNAQQVYNNQSNDFQLRLTLKNMFEKFLHKELPAL